MADDEEPTLEEALENLREATPAGAYGPRRKNRMLATGMPDQPRRRAVFVRVSKGPLAITEAAFVEARRGWFGFE